MAVELSGRQIRDSHASTLSQLHQLEKRFKGGQGVYLHNTFFVTQPEPDRLTHFWSIPEKVERRKREGWVCVTVDRAALYGVRPEEIDRANNIVRRLGHILMETELDGAAGKVAHYALEAIRQLDSTTDEFLSKMEEIGGNPRDLSDPKYAKHLRSVDEPTPAENRKKLGKLSDTESKRLREMRLFQQIERDARTQLAGGPVAATAEMVPQGGFDPRVLRPGGVKIVDGVREIVLSANPDLTADFD